MKLDVKEFETKMQKSIASYEYELSSIRVGRASAQVLNKISVDYWGTPTPIAQMAEVKTTDARTLLITTWDASSLKNIERAIQESDLGINPQNDGKTIRLVFPALTEERRLELKKQVSRMGEEAKVAIRNVRREANDKIKTMKKNSEMTEDEQKASEKDTQDLTDKYIKIVDDVTAKKDREVMEI